MNRPIFLVGLSGSGKSTVGKLLAARLQLPFRDTDAMVEEVAGKSVADIFATRGEAEFRAIEREQLARAAGRPAVIATGGGAPLDPANRQVMAQAGNAYWLDADTSVLVDRLRGSAPVRPLLAEDPVARLAELRNQRHPVYQACGPRIDTTGLAPHEVAALIAIRERQSPPSTPSDQHAGLEPSVSVNTSAHAYGIYVGTALFERLPQLLDRHGLSGRMHVIADARVAELHNERIRTVLAAVPHTWHVVPAGEASKTIDHALVLYDALLAERPERGDLILALGGGVVGDLAGFVAATLLRGVRFAQVPTTLLSQVDSSVGGKVGVDHPRGKNVIGAFHQPSLVLADLDFLHTLPSREIAAGMAEIVKIAVMRDAAFFSSLESNSGDLASLQPAATASAVTRAIQLKAELVEQDERDITGARALLNYGHTLGHALEAATGYDRLLHGEAVAIGMGAAARLAQWMNVHPVEAVDRQDVLLQRLSLPDGAPGTDERAIRAALGLDKKREGGALKWVLPMGIGEGRSGCDVPDHLVSRAIDWMLEGIEAGA